MPEVQEAVVQGTLWKHPAAKSHRGLTHVRVISEPAAQSDGGMCRFGGQRPSSVHRPAPRQTSQVQTIWVNTPEGLHLRKCAAIAERVGKYQAKVTLQKGDQSEDAASVLGLMLLAATQGTPLTLSATGPEAELAIRAVVELFDDGSEAA
jgi:phosphotransferase system HPr (HPr) family protein